MEQEIRTVGITGGSGFVGKILTRLLIREGYEVVIFSRSRKGVKGPVTCAHWNPARQECDTAALSRVDAVVHLAGAGVADKRWTDSRKKEIISSRVDSTAFLLRQLEVHATHCKVFIAASATGYYGPDRPLATPFREGANPYHDFLGEVCRQWESASLEANSKYRTVIFRFGIVLGRGSGAFPKLAGPMSFGIMPILGGKGDQMVSWVHVSDVAHLILTALQDEKYRGIYNAVAPEPVSHRQLMKAIGKAKGGVHFAVPVPPFALRMILGDASIEVLKSCTASADKLMEAGYRFRYPTIKDAARELVHKAP